MKQKRLLVITITVKAKLNCLKRESLRSSVQMSIGTFTIGLDVCMYCHYDERNSKNHEGNTLIQDIS